VILVGVAAGLTFFVLTHFLMRQADDLAVIIGTLAVSIIIINTVTLLYGSSPHRVPGLVTGESTFRLGGGVVSWNAVLVFFVAVIASVALHLWFERSRAGQAVRACAEDPRSASLSGISVRRSMLISWTLGCVFAAVSGVLIAPEVNVSVSMGLPILFAGFVAAAIGGFGSILGGMASGLIIGVVEGASRQWISADLIQLVPFALLVVVLLVKPTGLVAGTRVRSV
jgi:branched-subunit amino acid ABC-type transport system permease component